MLKISSSCVQSISQSINHSLILLLLMGTGTKGGVSNPPPPPPPPPPPLFFLPPPPTTSPVAPTAPAPMSSASFMDASVEAGRKRDITASKPLTKNDPSTSSTRDTWPSSPTARSGKNRMVPANAKVVRRTSRPPMIHETNASPSCRRICSARDRSLVVFGISFGFGFSLRQGERERERDRQGDTERALP